MQSKNIPYHQFQNPPQPPPSGLSSAFEEKVLKALERIEVNTQTLNSHTQSIAKLEVQIGQLATAFNRREEGKLPSQPISNPKGQFMVESSNTLEPFSEHVKSIMTLRNGKVIEQASKSNKTDPKPSTESEPSKTKADQKVGDEPITPEPLYLPKVSFSEALKAPIPADKKEEKLNEMMELFKQV